MDMMRADQQKWQIGNCRICDDGLREVTACARWKREVWRSKVTQVVTKDTKLVPTRLYSKDFNSA